MGHEYNDMCTCKQCTDTWNKALFAALERGEKKKKNKGDSVKKILKSQISATSTIRGRIERSLRHCPIEYFTTKTFKGIRRIMEENNLSSLYYTEDNSRIWLSELIGKAESDIETFRRMIRKLYKVLDEEGIVLRKGSLK